MLSKFLVTITKAKFFVCLKEEYRGKLLPSADSKTMELLLKRRVHLENINRVLNLGIKSIIMHPAPYTYKFAQAEALHVVAWHSGAL